MHLIMTVLQLPPHAKFMKERASYHIPTFPFDLLLKPNAVMHPARSHKELVPAHVARMRPWSSMAVTMPEGSSCMQNGLAHQFASLQHGKKQHIWAQILSY